MNFNYSKENLSPKEAKRQRLLEIIPGITSWAILIGLTLFAMFLPYISAIVIVAFYLYWFLRMLYMTLFLVLSYVRLRIEKNNRLDGSDTRD